MAFTEGTQILTDGGWKNIEDIAGRDRVLVRNFLGEGQFIQPFALKKKKYSGDITEIGGKYWNITTTPEHIIAYDRADRPTGDNFVYEPAKDVIPNPDNRIYRKFKYHTPEDYKKENIVIYNEFGKSWVNISNQDWFVLVGYVLCRGYLEPAGRKKALNIYLDRDKREDELVLLADILDRIGVKWSLIPSRTQDRWLIRVNPQNTLASKLIKRLGSKKRKKMYLSDKIIYNASKDEAKLLIETIVSASKRSETERGTVYQFHTNNERLVSTLSLLGTLNGYSMTSNIMAKKGTDTGKGTLSKDVFKLIIKPLPQTYSPTYTKTHDYNGSVYEIYLLDGQVYVKNEIAPVWVNPK